MTSTTRRKLMKGLQSRVGPVIPSIILLMLFVIVFLAALFSDFLPTFFGAYSDQRFLLVVVLLSVLLVSLLSVTNPQPLRALVSNVWPCLLLSGAFLFCALPFMKNEFNWVEPGLFAFYFLAVSVLGWRLRSENLHGVVVRLFILVSVVACFFYAAMTITVFLFALSDRFSSLTDIIPWGFVNMRYWSHIASWLLPLLPLAVMVKPSAEYRKWHWCIGFTAAIWWWVVFMTTARGTMISLALACALALLLFREQLIPWLKIFLKHLLLGGAAWLLLSVVIPSLLYEEVTIRTLHATSSGRLPLWQEAWLMSLENLPFGQGPQAWLTHKPILRVEDLPNRLGHPHNMYLMWAAEYGWLLIIAFLILVFTVLKRLISEITNVRVTSAERAPLVAFSIATIAGFAHAGVSAVFIVPASMLMGLCVLGIFWSLIPGGEQGTADASMNGLQRRRGFIFCAIIFCIVLAGSLWSVEVWRYHQAMEADLIQYEEGGSAGKFPRFWFHGNFPRAEQ